MRAWLLALLVLPLLPVVPAHMDHPAGEWPPGNHSPGFEALVWSPESPARGQDVTVTAVVKTGVGVESLRFVHCRVQRYACALATPMTETSDGWVGTIPWDRKFFDDVTTVGINLTLDKTDGSREESPVDHWPSRPADLPEGGGIYYYYTLPPEEKRSPGPAAAFLLAAILGVGVSLRSLRR